MENTQWPSFALSHLLNLVKTESDSPLPNIVNIFSRVLERLGAQYHPPVEGDEDGADQIEIGVSREQACQNLCLIVMELAKYVHRKRSLLTLDGNGSIPTR